MRAAQRQFGATEDTATIESGPACSCLDPFTRLTIAFSKKLANLKASVALHYAHYNICARASHFALYASNGCRRDGSAMVG